MNTDKISDRWCGVLIGRRMPVNLLEKIASYCAKAMGLSLVASILNEKIALTLWGGMT